VEVLAKGKSGEVACDVEVVEREERDELGEERREEGKWEGSGVLVDDVEDDRRKSENREEEGKREEEEVRDEIEFVGERREEGCCESQIDEGRSDADVVDVGGGYLQDVVEEEVVCYPSWPLRN
jgi:hypothetical protein